MDLSSYPKYPEDEEDDLNPLPDYEPLSSEEQIQQSMLVVVIAFGMVVVLAMLSMCLFPTYSVLPM